MASAQRYALPLGMRGKPTRKEKRRSSRRPDVPIGREAGRSHFVLNQPLARRDVTDRARSKPDQAYEGTRY
ncbi:hypothetical protein BTHE68_57600 (plasmid) [Burkholderia sp. THE68]|nr:hypothetical protein BTHE68_57600 [Burkholderia sp. THE68]